MLHVTSEIGRLRRVLVHEPGPEVDVMVPSMMEELLFDDILYGEGAREEHRIFQRLMQLLDVEVLDARTMLREILDSPEARGWILEVLREDVNPAVLSRLEGLDAETLASVLVEGLRREAAGTGTEVEDLFLLPPLPNWCFQRDPQVVLLDGVIFCAMAAAARHREALLARALFRFHPGLGQARTWFDPMATRRELPLFAGMARPCLEGGDVLVLSRGVIAVGISERTNRTAVRALARALARAEGPRWLYAVVLPRRRAYMHLDTVLTPLDRDACLVYPPVILGPGPEQAQIFEIDLEDPELNWRPREQLLAALRQRGLDWEPIPCGGADPLSQQREQWTDGANALALAPGVITLYDRNVATAEELDRRGFRVVRAEDVLLGKEEVPLDAGTRACVLLPSHEISRARGGPHCLVHPLQRDPL